MTQWRRRNRNTFARIPPHMGRRYADDLPKALNEAFDAMVAYREAVERYARGGGNILLVAETWRKVEETVRAVKLQS